MDQGGLCVAPGWMAWYPIWRGTFHVPIFRLRDFIPKIEIFTLFSIQTQVCLFTLLQWVVGVVWHPLNVKKSINININNNSKKYANIAGGCLEYLILISILAIVIQFSRPPLVVFLCTRKCCDFRQQHSIPREKRRRHAAMISEKEEFRR